MALATDNATTNDEIFRNVSRYLLSLYRTPEHADRHIQCLAHVINLVVQAILAGLDEADSLYDDPVNELRNDDLHDYYLQNKDTPIHYDVATDPTQDELEAARDDDMAMEFLDVGEFDDELLGIEDEIEDELKQLGLTSALKKVRVARSCALDTSLTYHCLASFHRQENRLISSAPPALLQVLREGLRRSAHRREQQG